MLEIILTHSMFFFFLAPRKQIDPGLVFCQADASQGQGVEMIAHECAPDLSRKRK